MIYDSKSSKITFSSGTKVYASGADLWPAGDSGFSYGGDGGVDFYQLSRADALEAIAEAEKQLVAFRAVVENLPDWRFADGGENPAFATLAQQDETPLSSEPPEMPLSRWIDLMERRDGIA